jgi:hypothetical protein
MYISGIDLNTGLAIVDSHMHGMHDAVAGIMMLLLAYWKI